MKLSRRTFWRTGVGVAIFSTGCIEPSGPREVGFESSDVVSKSDPGYEFESSLRADAIRTKGRTYEEIVIEFYDADHQLLAEETVSQLVTDGPGTVVSVTLNAEPVVVVPVSQTFWTDSNLHVYGLTKTAR